MTQDQDPKLWQPARFTHNDIHGAGDGPFGHDPTRQHTVIILNNPIENKDLLASICTEGMCQIKARKLGAMADMIHQHFALYVLTAEQMNSILCTSLEKKKSSVSVLEVFASLPLLTDIPVPGCHMRRFGLLAARG